MLSPHLLLLITIFHFLAPSHSQQQKCFDTRGVETNNLPCDPSASAGPCCSATFVCLNNGLCTPGPLTPKDTVTEFYQGSCTDATWQDPKCPRFCMSALDATHGQGLNGCSGSGVGKYCCWRNSGNCCNNASAIVDLGIARVLTTLVAPGSTTTASTSSVARSSVVMSSIAASSASTSSASTSLTMSTPASSSPTQSSDAPSGGSPRNTTAIGAGVGVGVGAVVLLSLAVGILWYRKRKSQRVLTGQSPDMVKHDRVQPAPMMPQELGTHAASRQPYHEIGAGRPVYEMR
jgi:hypothetical protein